MRTASVAARNAGLTDGANSERIISYGNNKQKVSEREKVTFSLPVHSFGGTWYKCWLKQTRCLTSR